MKINVNLGILSLSRIDETVTYPLEKDEKVLVSFTSALYSLGTLAITAKNGENEIKCKTSEAEIDITELCRLPGAVDMEVSLVVKSEKVKSWRIEPLLIREIEHKFEPIPELVSMRNAIATMQAAIVEIYSKIESNNEM